MFRCVQYNGGKRAAIRANAHRTLVGAVIERRRLSRQVQAGSDGVEWGIERDDGVPISSEEMQTARDQAAAPTV